RILKAIIFEKCRISSGARAWTTTHARLRPCLSVFVRGWPRYFVASFRYAMTFLRRSSFGNLFGILFETDSLERYFLRNAPGSARYSNTLASSHLRPFWPAAFMSEE